MSLLLEALKKAEDDMRRRHPGGMSLQQDLPPEAAPAELAAPDAGAALPPQAAPSAMPEPPPAVMKPFPELSLSAMEPPPEPVAPAEMITLMEPPPAAPAPAPQPAPSPVPAPAPSAETVAPVAPAPSVTKVRPAAPPPIAEARAKAAARLMGSPAGGRVGRPNRRTVFLGGAAALVLVVFASLWWWVEQQTAQPLVAARPPATAAVAPGATGAASTPVPAAAEPAQAASVPPVVAAAAPAVALPRTPPPAEPATTVQAPARPVAAARPRPTERGVVAAPLATARSAPSATAMTAPQRGATAIDDLVLRRNPSLAGQRMQQAHADFQAGRTTAAAQIWQDILRTDPLQRDAWLGLAVLAHREGRRDEAVAAYRQVLRIAPENPEATAALSLLTNAASDPMEESRLRELLARSPNSAMLNSALARMLSAQNRWDEAQPLWFKAHASAPDEPSHAFNLAVAMDRLRKPALALTYYRKALELGEGRPTDFDMDTARARVRALSSAGVGGVTRP